ncbi:hypothetical protein DCCM_3650 [Desulfocucumis palustris]|uniref:Uncharacterized protein n=1 Tax=Desulfocucumis palustris TaxID=1898651 RepID=A0A2L2XKS6_9FIRM|nr:type II toxin-antitoxin system antitoxin SocA domain-containing protein [Desulfocucumis palustris]GBF34531.1 hypothetical protein DCCM_3650 [Desulfocucumis palustris]
MRNLKLACVIKNICEKANPGKKAMQKIVYFLQERGFNFGYVYGIHHYGPYCKTLENDIQVLELDGVVKREQYGSSLLIKPSEYIDLYIDDYKDKCINEKEKTILKYVIDNFVTKTPLELELLSTVHFVVKELQRKEDRALISDVVTGVESIKGDKFSEDEIQNAIKTLVSHEYLVKN